jgi:hypothetical protein
MWIKSWGRICRSEVRERICKSKFGEYADQKFLEYADQKVWEIMASFETG